MQTPARHANVSTAPTGSYASGGRQWSVPGSNRRPPACKAETVRHVPASDATTLIGCGCRAGRGRVAQLGIKNVPGAYPARQVHTPPCRGAVAVALDAVGGGASATSRAAASMRNRRGETIPAVVLCLAFALLAISGVIKTVRINTLRAELESVQVRMSAAETRLRAVTWLAERRLDPAAVRADSLRRACYAQVARNGGADCGL